MRYTMDNSKTIYPLLLFFLVHSSQTGVGLLNFSTALMQGAEQDSWVVLLLGGGIYVLVFLMCYYLVSQAPKGDIMSLHRELFGKALGRLFNCLLYVYFILLAVLVLRTYVNVLLIWVFPHTPIWVWCLLLVLASTYMVAGGFRVVTGINFWGVAIPTFLIFIFFYPFKYSHLAELLPMFNHSLHDYITSLKIAISLFAGVEIFLVYAPFVAHNKKNKRYASSAILYSMLLYLLIFIFSVAYFGVDFLRVIEWPTLKLSKTIQFRLIERFEYIYVFTWLFVIIGPLCLEIWSAARIFRQEFQTKSKSIIYISGALVFAICVWIRFPAQLSMLQHFMSQFLMYYDFIYLPFLFVLCWIRKRWVQKRPQANTTS
ncbi:GerAB/ArcD/ProY family transporter [Paenibacillus sp. 1001270B_150601_E10]|uniref:GerAB/ArcD/ProY family transporter n=1 Tax=Paenibacillus sp. 1001270B_150601_E10 TaxID=2787079 RepID=UPI001E2DB8BA|nr:GerAB/ArcD/ProY family transporter [Paenibacillus sp. 1001270B_150601_E10]